MSDTPGTWYGATFGTSFLYGEREYIFVPIVLKSRSTDPGTFVTVGVSYSEVSFVRIKMCMVDGISPISTPDKVQYKT